MNINDLSTDQIRRIIAIKKKIEKLQSKIDSIAGDGGMPSPFTKKKRRMYRAGRAAVAAAARKRWAKIRGKGAKKSKPAKKRKKFSAAARAKLAASARARWVEAKKAGKTTL